MRTTKKIVSSILLGLGGFIGSFYSLYYINPPFKISIEWCELLPFLAGMAFGGRYGLIAATLGLGAFFPLVLYANNGWASIVTSILLTLSYTAVGYFTGARRRKPAIWNNPWFIYPCIIAIYSVLLRVLFPIAFSFNPPFWYPQAELSIPISILDGIVAKGAIILLSLIILDDYLLKLPLIRKCFGMEIKKESRNNGWIALGILLVFGLLWCVFVLFDQILLAKTFPQGLLQQRDPHEIIALIVFFVASFISGSFVIGFMESRLKAEDELASSRESYRQIFEQAADGIFVGDAQGNYIDVNESGCKLMGYTRAEILHLNMHNLVMAEDKDDVTFRIQELNAGEILVFERRMRHKNGSPIPVEISARKLADGRLQGLVRDVSQRKQAEEKIQASQTELQRMLKAADESRLALLSVAEDQRKAEEKILQLNAELELRVKERTTQLEAANKELEAFSYSVSHDLRAPLRALDGYSTILISEYAGQLDEQAQGFLVRIQEASRRMGQLINDLLNLSRITRADFSRGQVNLSALAENIAAELKVQATERRVEFEIAAGMLVQGDQNLLRIAMENLMNNAYKFTNQREQAFIQVGMLEQDGNQVYFVRDNGAGFNMEYANKLFTPFQRLHAANEFSGTGIGLTIVQRIIARHHGQIWPEAAPDQGATFYFTLGE
jgi:PAS domain S-box-containing protein